MRWVLVVLILVGALLAGYTALVLNVSYSDGERAGVLQKFSRKGWVCKTWEGELAMGALHEGHLELVRAARARAERVVVSIFVNPMQFNRRDDFEHYPRPLEEDIERCAAAGVDVVYAPVAAAMYPEGFASAVEVSGVSEPLCGRARPGHFRGVTTVVTKLFHGRLLLPSGGRRQRFPLAQFQQGRI